MTISKKKDDSKSKTIKEKLSKGLYNPSLMSKDKDIHKSAQMWSTQMIGKRSDIS
tara:strand:- start:205 stop:369 length:165 start_codon:yes stop_codon:yes gene_type:complete